MFLVLWQTGELSTTPGALPSGRTALGVNFSSIRLLTGASTMQLQVTSKGSFLMTGKAPKLSLLLHFSGRKLATVPQTLVILQDFGSFLYPFSLLGSSCLLSRVPNASADCAGPDHPFHVTRNMPLGTELLPRLRRGGLILQMVGRGCKLCGGERSSDSKQPGKVLWLHLWVLCCTLASAPWHSLSFCFCQDMATLLGTTHRSIQHAAQ